MRSAGERTQTALRRATSFLLRSTNLEITFLIGAGVSMATGMPSTRQLTEAVLTEPRFFRHTSGALIYDDRPDAEEQARRSRIDLRDFRTVSLYQQYLTHIRDHIARQRDAARGQEVTYEDIYYVAKAVADELIGETNDPTAREFWIALEGELPEEVRGKIGDEGATWLLDCLRYIPRAVATELSRYRPRMLGNLHFLAELHRQADVERVHLFTLNHDTVLEGYLQAESIPFFDGFGDWDGDLRWLDPGAYVHSACKTLLYKLHGSCDWYPWRCDTEAGAVVRPGRSRKPFPQDAKGHVHTTEIECPMILVGTLNKAEDYQWDPFQEMVHLFVAHLRSVRVLVVCGHSFADRFLRGHLANWLRSDPQRRIVVVDPAADRLARDLSWTVFNGRCDMVCSGIEAVDWPSLSALITR